MPPRTNKSPCEISCEATDTPIVITIDRAPGRSQSLICTVSCPSSGPTTTLPSSRGSGGGGGGRAPKRPRGRSVGSNTEKKVKDTASNTPEPLTDDDDDDDDDGNGGGNGGGGNGGNGNEDEERDTTTTDDTDEHDDDDDDDDNGDNNNDDTDAPPTDDTSLSDEVFEPDNNALRCARR